MLRFGRVLEHRKEDLAFVRQMFVSDLLCHRRVDLKTMHLIRLYRLIERLLVLHHAFERSGIAQESASVSYLLLFLRDFRNRLCIDLQLFG